MSYAVPTKYIDKYISILIYMYLHMPYAVSTKFDYCKNKKLRSFVSFVGLLMLNYVDCKMFILQYKSPVHNLTVTIARSDRQRCRMRPSPVQDATVIHAKCGRHPCKTRPSPKQGSTSPVQDASVTSVIFDVYIYIYIYLYIHIYLFIYVYTFIYVGQPALTHHRSGMT